MLRCIEVDSVLSTRRKEEITPQTCINWEEKRTTLKSASAVERRKTLLRSWLMQSCAACKSMLNTDEGCIVCHCGGLLASLLPFVGTEEASVT